MILRASYRHVEDRVQEPMRRRRIGSGHVERHVGAQHHGDLLRIQRAVFTRTSYGRVRIRHDFCRKKRYSRFYVLVGFCVFGTVTHMLKVVLNRVVKEMS